MRFEDLLSGKRVAVVGLGASNAAFLRRAAQTSARLTAFDTRENLSCPDGLPAGVAVRLGPLDGKILAGFDLLVVGPGLSPALPALAAAARTGAEVVGDVELFARVVSAPVVGITGSNGKSTVTTLVNLMAQADGRRSVAAANIGVPVFTAWSRETELYVLELSSFELETTSSLRLQAGTILNVSEDHLDRYGGSLELYAAAKRRIYRDCATIVVNRDDPRTYPDAGTAVGADFGLDGRGYGRAVQGGRRCLTCHGERRLATDELGLCGVHNELNALAAMALADAVGIGADAQRRVLTGFTGLPHRCRPVRTLAGVRYYNDSKATNVASTEAAIRGLAAAHPQGMLLLAGGLGKGQDFTPLARYLGHEIRRMYCFGRDAGQLLALSATACVATATMSAALERARADARPGQAVLLSPACASFDEFAGFEDRGRQFEAQVRSWPGDDA